MLEGTMGPVTRALALRRRGATARAGAAGAAALALGLALAAAPASGPGGRPAAAEGLPRLGRAPNFALTTQLDGRVWLTDLRGRIVVLAFGCTACGACPPLVPALAEVAGSLGDAAGPRVVFALVTVDPARDTPRALRDFARTHGLRAPAWLFLTQQRAGEVAVVTARYGVVVRRAGAGVAADCAVRVVDGRGWLRARYDGAPALEALARDLRTLLAEPGAR
jgi:protein SCO1/2